MIYTTRRSLIRAGTALVGAGALTPSFIIPRRAQAADALAQAALFETGQIAGINGAIQTKFGSALVQSASNLMMPLGGSARIFFETLIFPTGTMPTGSGGFQRLIGITDIKGGDSFAVDILPPMVTPINSAGNMVLKVWMADHSTDPNNYMNALFPIVSPIPTYQALYMSVHPSAVSPITNLPAPGSTFNVQAVAMNRNGMIPRISAPTFVDPTATIVVPPPAAFNAPMLRDSIYGNLGISIGMPVLPNKNAWVSALYPTMPLSSQVTIMNETQALTPMAIEQMYLHVTPVTMPDIGSVVAKGSFVAPSPAVSPAISLYIQTLSAATIKAQAMASVARTLTTNPNTPTAQSLLASINDPVQGVARYVRDAQNAAAMAGANPAVQGQIMLAGQFVQATASGVQSGNYINASTSSAIAAGQLSGALANQANSTPDLLTGYAVTNSITGSPTIDSAQLYSTIDPNTGNSVAVPGNTAQINLTGDSTTTTQASGDTVGASTQSFQDNSNSTSGVGMVSPLGFTIVDDPGVAGIGDATGGPQDFSGGGP